MRGKASCCFVQSNVTCDSPLNAKAAALWKSPEDFRQCVLAVYGAGKAGEEKKMLEEV